MQGKIALEEHFAVADTMGDVQRIIGETGWAADVRRRLIDMAELRLAEMDRHGIERSILGLNSPAIQGILEPARAAAVARRANDELAAHVARHPGRLAGFAALPMQDPAAAAQEIARAVRELGFKGAMVNGFTQHGTPDSAVYYDGHEYRDFWATVAELGVPFYLHPRTQVPARAQVYGGHGWLYGAAWGFARETSIHALRLIGSGLFEALPGLQVILGHLGERIPYDMGRIDGILRHAPADYRLPHPPSFYLRRNFHVTTSGHFNDAPLRCAIDVMGIDRVMFSVDYPFEATADAATWFDATPVLTDAERRRIGRTNAARLFGLDGG
jgi:2,3-dihydroxybenzoate decarboxylase